MFFDTPKEEAATLPGFELMPPGIYRVGVQDSDYRDTKAGTGKYMMIIMDVLDGKFKGQKLFANFNLENPSEQACKIGKAQFKSFLAAAGITEALKDVHEAHRKMANKVLYVGVDQQVDYKGKNRNVVKKYLSRNEAPASKPITSPVTFDPKPTSGEMDEIPF